MGTLWQPGCLRVLQLKYCPPMHWACHRSTLLDHGLVKGTWGQCQPCGVPCGASCSEKTGGRVRMREGGERARESWSGLQMCRVLGGEE